MVTALRIQSDPSLREDKVIDMDRDVTDPAMDVPSLEANPDDDIHRVLVVADEVFHGSDFLSELRSHMKAAEARVEIFVVTPALAESGLHHEMADFDSAGREAGHRLDAIIAELRASGINAIGHVGDGDPVTAVGDGLREFPADELVIISHPESQRSYAEQDLWDRLILDFSLPISNIEVSRPDAEGAGRAIRVRHEPAKDHTVEEEIRATRNFPPLKARDTAGIIVGLLGTFCIGLIAVFANTSDHGPIEGRGAAIILIAIGSFLLNVGNTVGLLFFQSVRYTGIWERFMARLALLFTTVGLVAALILWLA